MRICMKIFKRKLTNHVETKGNDKTKGTNECERIEMRLWDCTNRNESQQAHTHSIHTLCVLLLSL